MIFMHFIALTLCESCRSLLCKFISIFLDSGNFRASLVRGVADLNAVENERSNDVSQMISETTL